MFKFATLFWPSLQDCAPPCQTHPDWIRPMRRPGGEDAHPLGRPRPRRRHFGLPEFALVAVEHEQKLGRIFNGIKKGTLQGQDSPCKINVEIVPSIAVHTATGVLFKKGFRTSLNAIESPPRRARIRRGRRGRPPCSCPSFGTILRRVGGRRALRDRLWPGAASRSWFWLVAKVSFLQTRWKTYMIDLMASPTVKIHLSHVGVLT